MQPIEQVSPQQLTEKAEAWRQDITGFVQALVRTPSPTGQEGALCELVASKMRELGYDEVFTDELGNVVGRLRGNETGPSVLFTTHLDDVPPGERAHWQHDPFGGELADDFVHGRGASDHKGALASMIYGGAILKHLGVPLKGDMIVAARVLEHAHASVGMRYLVDKTLPEHKIHADLVVIGNPTNLDVYLGHRGRVEVEVLTIGRTAHAGSPWLGLNAVYRMVPVIQAVQELNTTLPSHPFLEKSSLALTNITASPSSPTTVPDQCAITLDRRFLPSEDVDDVVWQVQSIINRLAGQDPELKAEVHIAQAQVTSHTGLAQSAAKLVHPFVTESGHALVADAVRSLEALGQSPRFGKWSFTTEGGYTGAIKKITTIGYAPGDEKFAHTPFDRVSVAQIVTAAAGYAAIARGIAG